MHALAGRGSSRSVAFLVVALLAFALAIRIGVVVVATASGSDDGLGDVGYHAQLIDDPLAHARGDLPDVEQYAPFLGVMEWAAARPWIAAGMSNETAQRLGSVAWDLLGMAVLLLGVARVLPRGVVFVGVMWAASPLVWPASAFSAQDETIAAAVVAAAVTLLLLRRREAAIVVLVAGLFLAKILLLPLIVAVLLTTPRASRVRTYATGAAALAVCMGVTWAFSATDGLTQQFEYKADSIGFSITPWSTAVMHQVIPASTAIRLSLVATALVVVGVVAVWSRRGNDSALAVHRLAAALFLACFAVLAISNPEYLAIAAPVALVACLAVGPRNAAWPLLIASALAWAVNIAYHQLPKAIGPGGTVVVMGYDGAMTSSTRVHDVIHQALLAATFVALLVTAWRFADGRRRTDADDHDTDNDNDSEEPIAAPSLTALPGGAIGATPPTSAPRSAPK